MGRLKSVKFTYQASFTIEKSDQWSKERLKEAIRYLALHPTLGNGLKFRFPGLKAHRAGQFRIFHRIRHRGIEIIFIERRMDVYR